MTKNNRETAGIWAEHLDNAHVECYGLLGDLKNDEKTEAEIVSKQSHKSCYRVAEYCVLGYC